MKLGISLFASLATASSLLGFAQPASADYSKVCAKNNGAYVAQYKLTLGSRDTGFSGGTSAGFTKCYEASDAWGSTPVPANQTFTLRVKAKGGYEKDCSPTQQKYSATGGTMNYKSGGTTLNVNCQQ
jgi:hypothetical protein